MINLTEKMYQQYEEIQHRAWQAFWLLCASLACNVILVALLVAAGEEMKEVMKEFDTKHTREIICPHCGYEHSDSWEYSDEGGTTQECDECGNEYTLEIEFDVTYCTTKGAN